MIHAGSKTAQNQLPMKTGNKYWSIFSSQWFIYDDSDLHLVNLNGKVYKFLRCLAK